MAEWAPISYKGFWDNPIVFITRYKGLTFLFDCPFEDSTEDYRDSYRVYLMPELIDDQLPKDWTTLAALARQFLGDIPVSRVQFDPTKRQSIEVAIIDEIMSRTAVAG